MKNKLVTKAVGIIMLALMLVGCGSLPFLSGNSQGDLEVVPFDLPEQYFEVSYVDYDQIIVGKNNQYANDPRYADITPDGLIDWTKNQTFEENEKTVEYLEKVTLNGKHIQLPMTFSDLDPAYQAFDSMEVNNFPVNGDDLAVQNKVNGAQLLFYYNPNSTEREYHFAEIQKSNQSQISVYYHQKASDSMNEIVGLTNGINISPNSIDLRVVGIGVGNTLNEMYEALGKPTNIYVEENGNKIVKYNFMQDDYHVVFYASPTVMDPFNKTEAGVYPNVITEVLVKKTMNKN